MKNIIQIIAMAFLALIANVAFSQSTNIGTVRVAGRFLGWDNTSLTPGPLEIHNDFAGAGNNINFLTSSTQQMIILNSGFVGIGKSFTSPASLLSVDGTNNPTGEVFRTNCLSSTTTIWRMIRAGSEYGSLFSGTDNNFNKQKPTLRAFCHCS